MGRVQRHRVERALIREIREASGRCVGCGGPRSKWNLCSYCARKLEGRK